KIELANVGLKTMKTAAVASLKAGQTVWFGCDVLRDMSRSEGILATNYFKKGELFDTKLYLSKADRLSMREANVSHAMTLTGVDIIDGKITKWKVENSWGEKLGNKGYFVMSDDWFDNYVYEVVVHQDFMDEASKKAANQEKIDLAPWDSLA
ncbi:MAG TPA: C1 family peptidase, partial [Tetragenococcus sp.]|nr:C1 family peptidase [Tetragenococcus sp.]